MRLRRRRPAINAVHAIRRPNIVTTGVPYGLPGDTRTPAALTPAAQIPSAAWFSYNTTSGYPRFNLKNAPPGLLIANVDFTDVNVSIGNAAGTYGGLTFRNCLFRQPTIKTAGPTAANPLGTPPAYCVNATFAIAGLYFEDCTWDGNTNDPMWPVATPYSASGGWSDVKFKRNHFFGFNDVFVLRNIDGFEATANYVHSLLSDKHSGYVKNVAAVAQAGGGTLQAGGYYFEVSAVTTNASFGTQRTQQSPVVEASATVAANGSVALTWDAFSPVANYTVTGYRVYVGRAPGVYDGFYFVAAPATSSTYTGQALTAPDAVGWYVASWAHPDAVQVQGDYARNCTLKLNDLNSRTPGGYANAAGIQIGAMTTTQDVTNLVYTDNWVDGSANHFNVHNPINFSGALEFSRNRIGGDYDTYLKHPYFQTALDTVPGAVWANNVWMKSGTSKTGVTMTRDAVIA